MALANDGKYYAKGGSGKQFVYNPTTRNISITENGQTRYVTTSNPAYQATLNAMNTDTGSNFGGGSYEDIYNSAQAGYEAAKGNSVLQAQAATEAAGAAMNAGQPVNATPVRPTSTTPVSSPSTPTAQQSQVQTSDGKFNFGTLNMPSRVPEGIFPAKPTELPQVQQQQPADTIPTQQPYVPAIDDIADYNQLFGAYTDTVVGTQNQQNAAIDAALAYQKYLIDQQRGSLAANKAAQDRDAYINYQRQINPYGYNAEALARMGLSNSGYSETALINYGNALMGAMQSNNISYYEGIQELERAKIEAQLEGDMNKAEIAADLQAQMAQTLLSLGQQKIQFEYQKYLNEQEAALNAEQMNLQRWMAEQEALAEQREADRNYELAQNELALKQQQINNDYAINQQKIKADAEAAAKKAEADAGSKNPYASIVGDENITALEEAVKDNDTNTMAGIIATIGLSNAADIITLLESVGVDNAFATAFAQGYLNRYYPTNNPTPSQNQQVNPSDITGNNLILGADYDYVEAVEASMANWQSVLDMDPMGYEGNRSAMENAMVEAINNAPNAETKEALKSVAQKYGFI